MESGYHPHQPGPPPTTHAPQDLRLDKREQGHHPGAPQYMGARPPEREVPMGRDYKVQDLSQRGLDRSMHGYKGDPRDFESPSQQKVYHHSEDPRKAMGLPPPAHSHHPHPGQMHDAHQGSSGSAMKMGRVGQGGSDSRVKSPAVPPSHPEFRGRPGPPPPLINSRPPHKLAKSPPVSGHHAQAGSITQGTPVSLPSSSSSQGPPVPSHRQPTPPQNRMEGSITRGTPVPREGVQPGAGRGVPHGQDPRMYEPSGVARGSIIYESGAIRPGMPPQVCSWYDS